MVKLPPDVAYIISELQRAGYEGYAVGGCIRDSILGRRPNDWDITTSALPQQVKQIFPRTIDTGIRHGTVTVMFRRTGYEVTTYRIDGVYEDSRHPKEVTFTPSLKEDLKRRDFTINAMAYNDRDGLVDIFDGQKDLKKGVIRAVGDAGQRFTEDALRMMRAVRFAAQLGYTVEEGTKRAITELAGRLSRISEERIQAELVKLVTSRHPEQMETLYETGITAQILPEFDRMMQTAQRNPHHCYSVGMHTIRAMQSIEADKVLRLAMLFHDMGKPDCLTTDEAGVDHFHGHAGRSKEIAMDVLRRLKFDNDTIRQVSSLAEYHDSEIIAEPKYVRRALNRIGEDIFVRLFAVKAADIAAQSDYQRAEKLEELEKLRAVYEQVKAQRQCFEIKDLAVTGKDLIEAGLQPGPQLGKCLQSLLDAVIDDPDCNQKEILLELVQESIF